MESKQRKVREHRVEVRLSEAEYQLIEMNNPFNSIAKLLRQSALDEVVNIHNSKAEESEKLKPLKVVKTSYSSTEKALLLELARIGNNVNQIAKITNEKRNIFHPEILELQNLVSEANKIVAEEFKRVIAEIDEVNGPSFEELFEK